MTYDTLVHISHKIHDDIMRHEMLKVYVDPQEYWNSYNSVQQQRGSPLIPEAVGAVMEKFASK